ncbi:DUF1911 domain-containing protein [Janthinobacterium lividum]|nr:DUF1911 domain-containing protein [Janthinobacterium lividum]
MEEGIDMVATGLLQPVAVPRDTAPENFMTATRQRAWDGVDQLSLERDISFSGYWSWEAAAITCLLDIDDSSYRNAKFYPADLVAFHRQPPCTRLEPA